MVVSEKSSERNCIHLFSPGKSIDKTFASALKRYRIDEVVVFIDHSFDEKNENEERSQILSSIERLRRVASLINVPVSTISVNEEDLSNIRDEVLKLSDSYPDSAFYFNITGGKKVISLNLFMMAVWINGSAYYVDKGERIVELSIPRIHPENFERDSGHYTVLKIVYSLSKGKKEPVSYVDAFSEFTKVYKPKRKNDKGRYPVPRRGTFSKLVHFLIDKGLLTESYVSNSHSKKKLMLTPDGLYTVQFVGRGNPNNR